MKLSIIIPHHNGEELLHNCLQSLLNHISIQDFEIIIVDNGSIDNSAAKAKEKFPLINLLRSETNLGYSGGCNFGAKNAKGEYIIFLNNDTLHTKNWIEELISFLDKNPQAGAAQPKILNAIKSNKFIYYCSVDKEEQIDNVTLKPFSNKKFKEDLVACNGLITNAGFQLPAEAIYLGKKILCKPLLGQPEQEHNAKTLKKLQHATVCSKFTKENIELWIRYGKQKKELYNDPNGLII